MTSAPVRMVRTSSPSGGVAAASAVRWARAVDRALSCSRTAFLASSCWSPPAPLLYLLLGLASLVTVLPLLY
ncbi:hypothetical protein, partial [Nonomuraea sp. NPDC049784]|uniref:hypothetical protein n=1 Tax=Nonomuraea sp. NPDC049784 TaxID=3154361 RepID=UPI0033C4B4C2